MIEALIQAQEQATYADALVILAVFAGVALCLWALSRF